MVNMGIDCVIGFGYHALRIHKARAKGGISWGEGGRDVQLCASHNRGELGLTEDYAASLLF
jgi:hypothetical protein